MKNELLTKGIILPSGEIGKNKINLVAGAITQPFAEMVWVTTGGDMETINRLTNVLVTMNNPTDRGSRPATAEHPIRKPYRRIGSRYVHHACHPKGYG